MTTPRLTLAQHVGFLKAPFWDLLFNLYMLPLGNIIREHGISFYSYADDTQLYISLSPNDISPIDKLVQCIDHINLWTSHLISVISLKPPSITLEILLKCNRFSPRQILRDLCMLVLPAGLITVMLYLAYLRKP